MIFICTLQEDDSRHDEEIGEAFQDQDNMAAILLRKHVDSGDLMMVSYKNAFFTLTFTIKVVPSYDDQLSRLLYYVQVRVLCKFLCDCVI